MKTLLTVLFFTTLTLAYDWSDTDFNILLQEDYLDDLDYLDNLDDVHQSKHNRFARDTSTTVPTINITTTEPPSTTEKLTGCRLPAPPPPRPQDSGNNRYQRACCGDRDDLKMHGDALRDIRRECFTEIRKNRRQNNDTNKKDDDVELFDMFNCRNIEKSKSDLVCAMECVARKKNLIDGDGYVIRQNTMSFVKSNLAQMEWQKKIIDKILEKCLKDSDNYTAVRTNSTFNKVTVNSTLNIAERQCNPSTLRFSHCLWREMQLSCPSEQIKDTRQCQRMRERLQKKEYPDFEKKSNTNRGLKQKNKGLKTNKTKQ